MPEVPPARIAASPAEVAGAFVAAARANEIEPTVELIGVLLAQSALETGHWGTMYNYNFGNVKATDAWVADGGLYTFYDHVPPHAPAPVSENLSEAQMRADLARSRPRTDGSGLPDMKVGGRRTDGRYTCWCWPSHVQTRFRAFNTLEEGAAAFLAKFTGRYAGAIAPAARGDVLGYVTQLRRLGPYFTADFDSYHRAVLALYGRYLPTARSALAAEDDTIMLPNTGAFRTDPDDIDVRAEGWVTLSTGVELTRLPLWDSKHDLAARIGFGPGEAWLKAHGMRLPAQSELDELHTLSHHVDPVTKVHQRIDTNHMMSHRWCAEHDAEVWRRLRDSGWDGDSPVVNFGKHWIAPTGTIYGWWTAPAPSTAKIQGPRPGAHGPTYSDYATNIIAARDVGDGPTLTPLELSRAYESPREFRLGLRLCHWLGYQIGLDPRERRGAEHHELILSYSEHARRGGTFLGVTAGGDPIWSGGYPLRAPSDEWAWCAYGRSAGLLASLLPGETPPHGLRAAVHELVTDARIAGTFHEAGSGYEPCPGDAAVSGRNGSSPLRGGTGHVETLIERTDAGSGWFIGGNEDANAEHGGRWRHEHQSFGHIEGWIET